MDANRGGIAQPDAGTSRSLKLCEEDRLAPPPRWVHYLAVVTAALTLLLIGMGGLVKSLEAGLSVPDWPLSYGQPQKSIAIGLFAGTVALGAAWTVFRHKLLAAASILCGVGLAGTYYIFGPMPGWHKIANVSAEHSHRLVAGTVGFLTAILAGALWTTDARAWVRRLGAFALVAVVVQAVLGGLTVHYLLPPLISASHGSLAQAFFAMLVTLAVATSPRWFEARPLLPQVDRKPLQKLALLMVIAIFVQIMLGASVRHAKYFPEYPGSGTTFFWHLGAHLVGLLWVGHTVAAVLVRIIRRHGDENALAKPATLLGALLGFQILLGIGALLFRLTATVEYDPNALKLLVTTGHVAGGALSLVTGVVILLQAHRRLVPASARPAPDAGLATPGTAA